MPTVTEAEPEITSRLSPLFRIILHNDPLTPMNYVVEVLISEFERGKAAAESIMREAHLSGAAYVMSCPEEEGKLRIDRAHSKARTKGYPLTFSMEPE